MVIAHGGIAEAEFESMHGDANVVSGQLQRDHYEELHNYSGHLTAPGWPHINLPVTRAPCAGRRSRLSMPTVTFLATMLDHYYWSIIDFDSYAATCHKLRELAYTEPFKLVVRPHPRYPALSEHEHLFKPDGLHVRFETGPSLAPVLEETDLALCANLTTAIIEVAASGLPVILFFYHYEANHLADPFSRMLPTAFPHARNLHELEELVSRLLRSSSQRRLAIRSQNQILPQLLASCGETASRYIADICQKLIDREKASKCHKARVR